MEDKYVLMVVPSDFPQGDAGSIRDFSFAEIYRLLGYRTILIGKGKTDREGLYKQVQYYSVYRQADTKTEKLFRYAKTNYAYKRLIKKIIKNNGFPSIIHINALPELTVNRLIAIAKKNNINILHDSTEWYSPSEFSHGVFDKAYILRNRFNAKVIRKPIRVIGISEYLTSYYQRRGLRAVRVPAIVDVLSAKQAAYAQSDSMIRLIYAGSPGKKDYINEIVRGIIYASKIKKKKFELHVLGVDLMKLKEIALLEEIPGYIITYGRVPRNEVEKVMLKMDFSVLLRPENERYAKAGFPTKVVEAMSHGIAMLCNLSSDLDKYLSDGKNSIIVKECDHRFLGEALLRISDMRRDEIEQIKRNARATAEQYFDYRKWVSEVGKCLGIEMTNNHLAERKG